MTTFYTNSFRTIPTRLFLVIFACFSYTLATAQCNPDVTAPVAVCDALTQVALSSDGTATIFAETFDDGSFDNCCDVTLEVRRDGSICPNNTDDANFGESVTFCCEDADAGNAIFVIMQVSDCNGNTNSCFTEVIVEDKLPPIAICPADTVITCGYFYDNLNDAYEFSPDSLETAMAQLFGESTLFDNCHAFGGIAFTISSSTFCEDFSIARTWTVSDGNPDNPTSSCTQLTQVIYENVWDVVFPEEITVNDFGMSTPNFTGQPEIAGESCGVFAQTYEDVVLTTTGDNCAKIIRTWTVINWCSGEVITNTQIINIQGGFAPIILCPSDFVVYTTPSTDVANVVVPLPTTNGDLNNYTLEATSDLPNFNELTYNANDVPEGTYTVTFTISDFCDNTATCTTEIQVEALGTNPNCPNDTTITCDFYQNDLEDLLSQLAGDSEAQNESLDQFFGAPSFQNGLNISSNITIDVNACGQGTLTRVWELDDTPTGGCFTPIASSTSANNGEQVCIDVTAGGFDNILSFQYSMNFDPNVLVFNSIVNPENIPDLNFGTFSANEGDIGISWFDNDLDGVTVSNGVLLYQVCFDIIGGGGQIAEVTFSGSPTSIEVVDADENLVCFEPIAANIAVGLGGPNGACFVPIASSTTTNIGGEICFDVKTNGFTDILNYEYKVNFDGNILAFANVYDSGNVGQSISYNPAGFDSNTVTWWTNPANPDGMSVPNGTTIYQLCFYVVGGAGQTTSVTFSDGEVNDGNTCFVGIANQINISTTPPPTNGCFEMTASSATPNEGDSFCLDATVNNFDDILSFQYTVHFDPTVLTFDNIIDPENIEDLNFGTNGISNGDIGISWFDGDVEGISTPNGTLLFQMCFNVIGTVGQGSDIVFINTPTAIEVVNSNEDPVCFDFNAGQVVIEMNGVEPLVVNPPPTVLCTQVITIDYTGDWSVVFPPDTTANCSFGVLDAGEPQISNDGCGLLASTYEDVIIDLPGDGYKILRTWTVINWCDNSVETHTQNISVNDDAAPNFVNNCTLPDVCLEGNLFSCPGGLTIPTPEVMDCSSDIDLTATSDFGNGFGPFVNVNPGQYLVTFTATDPFGNTTTCVSNVNVVDCVVPVAICDENLTVALTTDGNGDGSATIFAETLDDGSYDNCSVDLTYSFAANVVLNTYEFTCADLGNSNIQLFVTDENGNQNSCVVEVEVVDLLDICPVDPCDGSSFPNLTCNSNLQISLDNNGEAQLTFDMILEGVSQACIDASDLSFSANADVDVLNYDCSNLGSSTVQVYLTLDNGAQNSCWGLVSISDQIGACGDPTDCDDDVFPPTAYCKDGIVVELMHINDPNNPTFEPFIEVWAIDLDNGSFDNCSNDLTFSFSPDETDNAISFNCDDMGENVIELWVTDSNGNQSACETFIIVQMNQSQCGGSDPDCFGNTTAPVAICNNQVNVSLALSGEATIFAATIDEGSYDDCSLQVDLSFSGNTSDISTTFDCDNLGENTVTLYVSDENGNQSQCWATVVVSDNLNICNSDCLNDTTAPEAFCISAIIIQMPSTGALTLSASLFDVGSSDNCTDDLNLEISTVDGNGTVISGPATGLPFNTNNVGANNIVLTVTDEAGNSSDCSTILLLQSNPPQVIRGKIFMDENEDCTYDAGEMGLNTWSVKLEAIDDTLATDPGIVVLPPDFTIDADGNYTITLPEDFVFFTPDSSVVNVNNLNPYLRVSLATGFNYGQNCDYNYFINSTTNVLDTIEIDFPVQVLEDCPQLSVDVSVPYLRRCFDNTYTVNYCNFGNVEATDAYIEVDFDEFLIINNSSLPWTSIDGTTYRFDLGNVPAAECGSFEVDVTVSCDAVLGQTHCVQANIYPAVLCDPMSPQWSGASIDITGTCDGDEVRFTITNIGNDDMDDDAQFIVIEDFIMYNTGTFNLVAGESTEIVMPANGSTWRVEAAQAPNHPGQSMPSLAIEGCTTDGEFSLGMVTQFVQNDNDPFVSIHCIENIGSFDPNDKMAVVTGYGDDHYIDQNTDIEYMIRFQNTGTDTAFNVVVIDTLDVNLDPLSVRPGASSHPYDFTILGDNVLKFNFDNIALPDSNVNVALSQGYVKFRVSQYPDVALETVIENNAAIYFDFNEPIITNVVFHTIGKDFMDVIDNTTVAPTTAAEINIFPNPFEDEATVEIKGLDIQNGLFRVYDMQGRLLQTFDFTSNKFAVKREELPSGMYFYQLESKAEGLMSSGKLVIK